MKKAEAPETARSKMTPPTITKTFGRGLECLGGTGASPVVGAGAAGTTKFSGVET